MNTEKILKLNIYQPIAHYREAKVMQDDYIPSLPLPSSTTIAGMITYVVGERLVSKFKIGVVGNYEKKDTTFNWGEGGGFWQGYGNLVKGKDRYKKLKQGEYYYHYKKIYKNRIMYFEELYDVNLTIFLTTENKNDYEKIKRSLLNPKRYISLGRSEDFAVPQDGKSFIEEVDIYSVTLNNKREAVRNNILIKNTYIGIDIRKNEDEALMNAGILYNIPAMYKEFNIRKKANRIIEHGHFIYVNNNGYYPQKGTFNIYEEDNKKIPFVWLEKVGE